MPPVRPPRSARMPCRSTRRLSMRVTAGRIFPSSSAGCRHSSGNKETTMGAEAFKAARDFLFAHRTNYRTAHAEFRWPALDNFNYALDWFDTELARGESASRLALKIVGDGAATTT